MVEFRDCPLCGFGGGARVIQEMEGVLFFDDETPKVDLTNVQCPRCFLIYRNPTYSIKGMRVLFAKAAMSYGSQNPEYRVNEQVEWCRRRGLKGSILDFGCGSGLFLSKWPDGPRHGIDIDSPSITEAKAKHPGIIFNEGIRDTDVMVLWHTLEHVCNPRSILERLRKLAKPTTRLVVEVPVLEHGFTDDICGFLSLQHVTHFSKRTFNLLLRSQGWEPIDVSIKEYNGCRVICQPCDIWPKGENPKYWETAGDPRDVSLLEEYQASHRVAVEKINSRLPKRGVFLLWGGGMHTEMLYQETGLSMNMPVLVMDNDKTKHGSKWRGIPVVSPQVFFRETPLVISSFGSQDAIKKEAIEMGFPEKSIVELYDYPVVY